MYRQHAATALDERDGAVGALLLAEAQLAAYEAAARVASAPTPGTSLEARWRAVAEAQEAFPEIWRSLDRARRVLARRGANTVAYDEHRPRARRPRPTRPGGAADAPELDPAALADLQRAAAELRLALPDVDWQAIEARNRSLTTGAALHRTRRNGAVVAAVVGLAGSAVVAWMLTMVPAPHATRASARVRQAAEVNAERRAQLDRLRADVAALGPHCDPAVAGEFARLLAQDGQFDELRAFGAGYEERCGEDATVHRWARAPRPRPRPR